jgi:hypothetical protein
LCFVCYQGRVSFCLSFINDHRCLDLSLVDLSLHVDNHILLCLLYSNTFLDGHIGCLESILVLLRQVCLAKLKRLHAWETDDEFLKYMRVKTINQFN